MKNFGAGKLVIAVIIAIVSAVSYFRLSQENPVTGEKQRIDISPQQEVALGLQALPEMTQQFGGLDPDARAQEVVDAVGRRLVANTAAKKSPYEFEFHLLGDAKTVNAFALPGGQIFITRALFDRLKTEGQLAGVLGHEIGHVVGRHGAEQMAKQRFTQGLTGAAVIATIDPDDPRGSYRNAALATMIGQLVNLKYSRSDESESDTLGVQFLSEARYDPSGLIEVMRVLAAAGGGRGGPEFFQSHPNPENRIEKIKAEIRARFPNGVPADFRD